MTSNFVSPPHRYRFVVVIPTLLLVLSMMLAACGGGSTTLPPASTLRILSAPGQPNPDLFNPFFNTNQGGDYGAQGLLYEELYFTNLYTGQASAWLASNESYSNDLTQLTFKLRTDVKWSDGQPFSSNDVKFTFDLMKQYPALDQGSVWATLLKSVDAPDSSTVVFNLQHADSTALFRIGGSVFIVPQHIWANINGDPAKFANDHNPVGTGPYMLKSFTPDLITYTANPHYWGIKPQVQTIQIPSIKDNTTAITAMVKGQLDWAGIGWSPDNDAAFTGKDSQHNHTWFAASNTVMLYLNLRKAPFNNLLVRKAISAAIDRSQLPQGVAQYAAVANPTGVIIPTNTSWIAPQYQSMSFENGQNKVDSYLTQAGFKKGSDGYYRDASGKVLSLPIDVVSGWNDWDQDVQFIVNDLNKAGIKASMNSQSGYTPYYTAISTGSYDAAISWTNSGPTPYYAYLALLNSANAAPQVAVGTNFERWDAASSNGYAAKTDQLLAQYQSTSDPNAQMQAIQGIEDIIVSQLPVIPLTVNVYWDEYTTSHFTGWPSAADPYDSGAPYNMPDAANVILHLKPIS
ncbi:MAG TPA: ABC transporter substrate-binding protein [Ktedonosporobacter sp.]|jgi:peptide/nickel transport system substrate-binding protein|nr:ABC transporter substrate-binding protein [Ktedonosporobacter sp.]